MRSTRPEPGTFREAIMATRSLILFTVPHLLPLPKKKWERGSVRKRSEGDAGVRWEGGDLVRGGYCKSKLLTAFYGETTFVFKAKKTWGVLCVKNTGDIFCRHIKRVHEDILFLST